MKKKIDKNEIAFCIFSSVCIFLSVYVFSLLRQFKVQYGESKFLWVIFELVEE